MHRKRAEPAPAQGAPTAPSPTVHRRSLALRLALAIGGGALTLAALAFLAYALAVARVPQQRAALEELLRAETGLDVRFNELGVRWGWYGPEAVFRGVQLGGLRPGAGLLAARELVVGFDLWRMLRSGQLEAGRITLRDPAIDLTGAPSEAAAATQLRGAPATILSTAARVLAHWRGTRLDIEGGTVRAPDPRVTGAPLVLAIRQLTLRRTSLDWTGESDLLLPARLGSTVHLTLRLEGDPARPDELAGLLELRGQRLEFAGLGALVPWRAATPWLPRSGTGNVVLAVTLARSAVTRAQARLAADGVEWPADIAAASGSRTGRLGGVLTLTRRGALWRLDVERLELDGTQTPAAVRIEADPRTGRVSGRIQSVPVAALAAVARGLAPRLRLGPLALEGRARELRFEWGAGRAPADALHAAVDLEDVTLAPHGGKFALGGHVTLEGGAHGWRLATQDLEISGQDARLAFSGTLSGTRADIPWIDGRLRASGADIAQLRELLDDSDPGARGAAGRLTAGRVEDAWLVAHGPLDEPELAGALGLRAARLAGTGDLPEVHDLDADVSFRAAQVRVAITRAATRPVAGLPAIEALHGTLAFADGRLQHSTLSGTWLGGPVTLAAGERREHGVDAVVVTGRGLLAVREALYAATGIRDPTSPLAGSAPWSAQLHFVPGADSQSARWRLRADSSLVGLASRLPEPFGKPALYALPVRVILEGRGASGELHLSLGDRLRGVAAVERQGDLWRIERGAVSLGTSPPQLPAAPLVLVQGEVSRLDLPAYALLWRELTRDAAWPALHAQLTAGVLLAAGGSYPEVRLSADSVPGLSELRLASAAFSGEVRWPAGAHEPEVASVHLSRLDLPRLDDPGIGLLLAALGPAARLAVDELELEGRPLGALTATVTTGDGALDAGDVRFVGPSSHGRATLDCRDARCRARFVLDSDDAAATLVSLGLRPDLSATRAELSGELQWPAGPDAQALARTEGRLHIELDNGLARSVAEEEGGPAGQPAGLVAVPELIAALALPDLHFAHLTAGFEVHQGQALTSDLHLDGDAEILLRGRIGLVARDYDAQVWLLRGGERLPAAVRGFGPTPRMAALWLSLRELFGAGELPRGSGALHLQGTWDNPVVSAADRE